MHCSRKFPLVLVCVGLAVGTAATKKDEKVKQPREAKQDTARQDFLRKKAVKGEAKQQSSESGAPKPVGEAVSGASGKLLPKLSLPLVQGQTSKGVTIPYNDSSGAKTMNFRIGSATPVDADHIQMKDLTIETLNELGEKEMTIELPASMLDLNTRIITGNERVTIRRSDFEITGATMEFNTETKQGHIEGNVKMIIFDLSEEMGGPAPKSGGKRNE